MRYVLFAAALLAASPCAAQTTRPLGTTVLSASDTKLLDGCVISALGRLPKVDGLRVANSSYEFRNSHKQWDFYTVSVSVELQGRKADYQWLCRVYASSSAELLNMP